MSSHAIEAIPTQVRLRLRRWLGLVVPDAPRIRRSGVRRAVLAAGRAIDGDGPRARRRAITRALRAALDVAAAGDVNDPFVEVARAAVVAIEALEAAIEPGCRVDAWDAVLTVVELRPSSLDTAHLARALARAARNGADAALAARLRLTSHRVIEARGMGGYLHRMGSTTVDEAVGAVWQLIEPAFIHVAGTDEQMALVTAATENLVAWDDRVTEIARRVGRGRGGDDAAQHTATRFLEPRIVSAWVFLAPEALYRVALTCGRHAHVATLTGPEVPDPDVAETAGSAPGDDPIEARARWSRFFEGLSGALAADELTPSEAVFLWLSAGVGAGEAWRVTGGDLARIGSANYIRGRVFERLRKRVGTAAPERLANPGAPDPRSRALLGLLTMRDAPDPSVEADAGVPPDARIRVPPLDDRALVALLYLINLGPDAAARALPDAWPAPDDALLARSLKHASWARARRQVAQARIAGIGAPSGQQAGDGLTDDDVLFLLAGMVGGLPSEAARWLAERPSIGRAGAGAALVERWLSAGPGHEVIEALHGGRRNNVPAPPTLPRRPVERDARLRLHLRAHGARADG